MGVTIMGESKRDDGWRLTDTLWQRMAPLSPLQKPHPLGCHRPRVPNRAAMDAILLVLRTGMRWNALDRTGAGSCSAAYRRFRERLDAGVLKAFWKCGLLERERLRCIDWKWLALDGGMTKTPLGGGKNRTQPDRPTKAKGCRARCADRWLNLPKPSRGAGWAWTPAIDTVQ